MHIKFDDENLIVTNIQIFLKQEVDPMLVISGCYDESTHEALIRYLKTPNTLDHISLRQLIIRNFVYKESMTPFSLIDGGGIYNFDVEVTPEQLRWYTRPTTTSYNNGVAFIADHIEELSAFVSKYGWTLTEYTYSADDSTNSGRTRAQIIMKRTGIINRFPNDEVLPMINLFTGRYAYKRCITASDRFTGFVQSHDKYKLAYIPCSPGDTFTIAHGFAVACEMAVGYCNCKAYELKKEDTVVNNVKCRMASDGGEVDPGDYFYYEVPENSKATYLVIQLPYRDDLTVAANETVSVMLGDINQDGIIDSLDVSILNSYVSALEANQTPPVSLEGNALIAANVTRNVDLDGNPIISRDDVTILEQAVESGNTDNLGTYEYQQSRIISQFELDRLLIMSGELAKDDNLNIPVSTFWTEPWAVHSEFVEYFLGRVIHKYSDVNDIAWLQHNIQKIYTNYRLTKLGTYDCENDYFTGDYIKRNNLSGNWEYFKDEGYTGYFMSSEYDLMNGVFRRKDGVYTDIKIVNGRLYVDGKYTKNIVLDNGYVTQENAKNSLKACVKDFQNRTRQREIANNRTDITRYWTIGYYNVSTDEAMLKTLGDDVVHYSGAFR